MTTDITDDTVTRPVARPARPATARLLALLVLPLAPAFVALLRLVVPGVGADDAVEAARDVAAHQGAQNAAIWLGFAAWLTLPVAAVLAARFLSPGAPRLTRVAEVLLVPAYLCIGWLVAGDAVTLKLVREGLPPQRVADITGSLHPAFFVGVGVFVAGHVLGTVLLGVAALRSHLLPTWAGVALTICQPVHFVALVVLGNPVVDCVGWGLNAVAFGVIGWRQLHRP